MALVIGNNDYRHIGRLDNAVADARAFKREMEGRGFQVVHRENADRSAMNAAVREFVGRLSSDAVGVVYYSGHGVQIGGANYLLPTDLKVEKEGQVIDDAVELGRLLEMVSQTQARFTLAIVDACRDNLFRGSGRAIGGKGLASPVSNANGIMVVYSAGANQQALDRLDDSDRDPNGLFMREFLKAMSLPGRTVQDVVNAVKMSVIEKAKAVGHVQTPAIYDQSVGTFLFTPDPVATLPPSAPPVVPDISGPPLSGEFSLEDLAAQDARVKGKWDQWQKGMQGAFDKTAAFSGSAEVKRAAWERFLSTYSADNPYSGDDEALRAQAETRKASSQQEARLILAPSLPKAGASQRPRYRSRRPPPRSKTERPTMSGRITPRRSPSSVPWRSRGMYGCSTTLD
ncbi:MAG: peptidase C14 caspase catalytic subunit p20 [Rhodospirillaceae bacterium]|nr:MAG: peptidase C14 caspase catalytic subunit p20 [Rhodospirillaceae bacterium]